MRTALHVQSSFLQDLLRTLQPTKSATCIRIEADAATKAAVVEAARMLDIESFYLLIFGGFSLKPLHTIEFAFRSTSI